MNYPNWWACRGAPGPCPGPSFPCLGRRSHPATQIVFFRLLATTAAPLPRLPGSSEAGGCCGLPGLRRGRFGRTAQLRAGKQIGVRGRPRPAQAGRIGYKLPGRAESGVGIALNRELRPRERRGRAALITCHLSRGGGSAGQYRAVRPECDVMLRLHPLSPSAVSPPITPRRGPWAGGCCASLLSPHRPRGPRPPPRP